MERIEALSELTEPLRRRGAPGRSDPSQPACPLTAHGGLVATAGWGRDPAATGALRHAAPSVLGCGVPRACIEMRPPALTRLASGVLAFRPSSGKGYRPAARPLCTAGVLLVAIMTDRRPPDLLPLLTLLAIVLVLLAGWWLFPRFQRMVSYQDCVASGHVNC